jgi:thiol:disulfide interchange protein
MNTTELVMFALGAGIGAPLIVIFVGLFWLRR